MLKKSESVEFGADDEDGEMGVRGDGICMFETRGKRRPTKLTEH